MGRIAQRVIATFREQSHDLTQAANQFGEGLPEGLPSPEELANEGYDPQHILYIAAQNFASLFGELVSEFDEFQEYAKAVEEAEDVYMPSSPPMSPITGSFFYTWALFDLRFGADQETVGGCLLEVMRAMQAPEDMLAALEKYSGSRMGIYEHLGQRRGKIWLRELVTGNELRCQSTTGYRGHKNELWYVRLCPPLNDCFDYHVAVTTPYILTASSAEDWTAYLNKQLMLGKSVKRPGQDAIPSHEAEEPQALHELLKYGNQNVNWMEFVFQGYHHFQHDAIFLAGIPDVPASLPHSPVHDETEAEPIASDSSPTPTAPAGDEVVRVKFTEVQRKVIASLCPELSGQLRLSERNQRTVELREHELERVIAAARDALPNTKGARRTTLRKLIASGEPAKPAPSAATVYQFKVTLSGSKPPIWRRIQIEDCTLADLHYHIQAAMGWHDSHLHEFNIEGERYAATLPFAMGPDDAEAIDASTIKLSQLIGRHKKFRCQYLYDFGDSWEHQIELEDICAAEAHAKYPRCTDGARACPPEDCGGIWAFYDFVAAITDRKHPEHRELKEWYGGSFQPDEFDTQKATRKMRK